MRSVQGSRPQPDDAVDRPADRPISFPRLVAFSVANVPFAAIGLALAVFVPRHYARHLGLDLAVVGGAFSIVRLIDIPIDLILGFLMDRTRTALGRYRPWTLAAAPILMVSVYLLFVPAPGVGRGYLIGSLLITYLGGSILMLSTLARASTLGRSYDQRSRVFGVVLGVAFLGSVLIMAVPIVDEARGVRDALNVPTMGYLILLITPLAIGLSTLLTPEPVAPDRPGRRVGLFEPLGLLRRPTLRRLVLAELCVAIGPGWMSALFLFFFTDSRGFSIGQASLLLAAYFLAGLVGAPAAGLVATRQSKHRTLMVFAAAYVATVLCFALIPRGNLPVAAACLFIAGGLGTGLTTLTRAMMADVADEICLEQDRQWTGVLYAMIVMAQKVGSACSIAITFFLLDRVGFRPALGAHNTPEALHWLDLVFLSGPIAFVTLGAICILGYGLTAERHAHIRRQLDLRDGGGSAPLDIAATPRAPRDPATALAPDAAAASAAPPAA